MTAPTCRPEDSCPSPCCATRLGRTARSHAGAPFWETCDAKSPFSANRSPIQSRARPQNRCWTRSPATCSSRWSIFATTRRHAGRILRPRRIGKPFFFFRGARFETSFEPQGVALIFGPSNYPFQLSVIPLITALAAGNAVVLKCSERTPETAALIAKLCAKANLPPTWCRCCMTVPNNPQPSLMLARTSSSSPAAAVTGSRCAERAAKHLIPTILELGGKDASLVFADCHLRPSR